MQSSSTDGKLGLTAGTSIWKQVAVDLPFHNGGTGWTDFEALTKVAWLLLLSTYEDSACPTCYLCGSTNRTLSNLLTMELDSTLCLSEQATRLLTKAASADHGPDGCHNMLWQGSVAYLLDWTADSGELLRGVKLALAVGRSLKTSDLPHEHAFENRVSLLFDQSRVRAGDDIMGRVKTLEKIISVLIDSPTRRLADVSFLSDYDKARISSWNQPLPDAPVSTTIPLGFAASLQKHPDASAIYAWDGRMTYEELDATSSSVALILSQTMKSEHNNMVLLNMRKSKWALVAALSILKAGKTIVPVDPDWPQARFAQIAEITSASYALCDPKTQGLLGRDQVHEIIIPLDTSLLNRSQSYTACLPSDLAYVLFSSGSTGTPKGMLREHGTACTASFVHAKAMHMDNASRVLQFANHVFDVAMLDFFTALLVGACVCIPSEHDRKNDLPGFVMRSRANWALLTPTVASILDPATVPSMKFVTFGGESIGSATLRKWAKACRVGINYGSAEVDVTHVRDVTMEDMEEDISNVGKRLPSCTAYIVNAGDASSIVPVGAVGELVISGPTMAREYLKNPTKTAEAFLQTPSRWVAEGILKADAPAYMSRIYRMGDLFRQRSDGSIDFVSRKDFQVKVNGQKVELGDIETKLEQHPAVKHCAVLYPLHGPYTKRLVAVVRATESRAVPTSSRQGRAGSTNRKVLKLEEITDYLSQMLPSFMLPSLLATVSNMPYTPTMKIDRVCLRNWLSKDDPTLASRGEISRISNSLAGSSLSPSERQAIQISGIVADVVAAKRSRHWDSINGHDHFLVNIGIDSAQAMRLASNIQKEFGIRVPVEILGTKGMSARKLAAFLAETQAGTSNEDHNLLVIERTEFLRAQIAKATEYILEAHADQPSLESNSILSDLKITARRVLLTGATGYLGVQLLIKLLETSDVLSVTVIVRSSSPEQALERIRHALSMTGRQQLPLDKLHAVPGDISKPHFGMLEAQWDALFGGSPRLVNKRSSVDTIIHCGAAVDWTKSYEDLEAANVKSTEQLLKAALASPEIQRLVYISGGRYPDPLRDLEQKSETALADAAQGTGYAQTKFVAERMVEAVRTACRNKSMHIVRPSYLIGGMMNGDANQDDYIWRIVWASARLRAFNGDEQDQWLFVAEVDQVAERTVALTLQGWSRPHFEDLDILDGLSVHEFWNIIADELHIALTPQDAETWSQRVREDMEEDDEHLLWPLADTLSSFHGQLTKGSCAVAEVAETLSSATVSDAVRRNVQCLRNTKGFFVKRE